MTAPTKYAVTFTNARGEQCHAVVSLDDAHPGDRDFLERNRITRPAGAGAPGGPIERMIAYTIARQQVPGEFAYYDLFDPHSCCWVN
jgi:hypothetical protein